MMEWPSFSFTLLASTSLVLLLIKIGLTIYNQYTFWSKRGVPHISAAPLFGTGWKLLLRRITFPDYCQKVYKEHPEARYIGAMDFNTPLIILRDPELIKDICVKHFEYFPDHRAFVSEDVDPLFGKNIFSLRGDRWREMRNTLSPTFTASKMRFIFELVSKCAKDFTNSLMDRPELIKCLDTKDAFTRYTNDVIATSAFGITVNSMKDKENEFFVRGKDASMFGTGLRVYKFILFRLIPKFTKMIGMQFFSRATAEFFKKVVSETIQLREEKGIVRPDMIHLLMQARDKENEKSQKMSIDDIVAQAFIFFFAGFETSSTVMCFALHEITMNPDVQKKLREEIDQYMEDKDELTYEDIMKMEYMEMVISETLRKYPPVIFIDRVCVKTFELPPATPKAKPFTVEPDNIIWLPTYAFHHDPNYFPEPDKFDPERFNDENKDKIDPYAYMPFGLGPRKCIGNRFALMEIKVLLAYLLQKFEVHSAGKTQHPIVFSRKSFNLIPDSGFWVRLEKRK